MRLVTLCLGLHACSLASGFVCPLRTTVANAHTLHRRRHLTASVELDGWDEDEDEEWEDLTEEELEWAAQLEAAIVSDQVSRAAMEQEFLGLGEPLPCCLSASQATAALRADGPGVARLAAVLSPGVAADLRAHVLEELASAKLAADDGRLSKVIAPTAAESATPGLAATSSATAARWDLRLAMSAVVRRALQEMLCEGSELGDVLEAVAGGRKSELWELGALVSSPGAAAQIVHADVSRRIERRRPSLRAESPRQ